MKKITFNFLLGIALLASSVTFAQANNDFANAEAIACGLQYTGTTVGATLDEDTAPDGFGADMDAPNVWYSFTGSGAAETVTLNLCNSAYDSSVLVYTGTSGNLTLIAGNDDDNTCGAALTTRSRLSFDSDGSTTYYIAIEGWNAASTGVYTMDVTCAAVTPPAVDNQTCLTALVVDVDASIITSDNSFGDVTPTQPTCDTFGSIQDVWFSFVAPSATVDCTVTNGTMLSANFAIYSGTCDALTSLACRSNLTVATTQSLTTLVAGETYFVQVWSNGAEQGEFTLSLSDPSICLPVATFSNVANCIDNNFTVDVDVTSLASASSVTITDNQSSTPQTVSATGIVTFGPYAFATSVTLTITNDQSPGCALVSPTQSLGGCPPANDECDAAIALTVNADFNCTDVTAGTIVGASASTVDTAACGGTEDDDVWFSFVATNATHTISLLNVAGSTTDLFHSVWTGADCASLGLVANSCSDPNNSTVNGLTPGDTYYLRVYSWTATVGQTSTFDVCIGTPPPPPANDECDAAIVLTVNPDAVCTDVTPGTIASATPSSTDTAACFGTEDDDVWFSFVATSTAQIVSLNNVAGSTTDLFHSLWTGADCASLTLVPNSCSDANNSAPSGLTIGDTYYLRVYSWTATAGQTSTFDVCIGTPPPPPANDECDAAIALTVNPDAVCTDFTSGTIASATPSATDAAACGGTEDDDVWYSFVATSTAQLISLNNVAGSTTDLYHSLWTGADCASLTLVPNSCSDANNSAPSGLTIGDTYYLRVYSWTATAGQTSTFDVCIGTPPPPPANDECDAAVALSVNPDASCTSFESGTIASATASAVDAAACGGTEDDDVWYSFVATDVIQSISLFNVAGSTTDLYHSLWTGDCGTLTLVPGSCSDNNASVPTGLTAGETYYVRVYSTTATTGQTSTFDICVGTPPPPPANDDCIGAIEITPGGTFDASPVVGSNVSSTTTGGLTFACQTNRSNDVWYSVVVPDSGSLTVETAAAPGTLMTDSVISVFTGVCGSLVEVGCNDDDGTDNFSKAVLTGLTPGETLYIGVWKWGTSVDGDFQLSAYDASLLSNDVFETTSFKAYPNPVKNFLNLSHNKNISNVAVYNLLGQEVIANSMNANQSQIDMSHLSNGTYLVKVTADNQVKTIKVIKE